MKKCDCKLWQSNIPKMLDIFILAFKHEIGWDGDLFKFCPWCGALLEREER